MTLKLEQWLALIFFGLIIIFTSIVSLSFYAQLQEATLERVQNQLLSINILKKRLVEQYLDTSVPTVVDSARALELTPALMADLEAIVTERTGMGTTGESYLVDEQGAMITASVSTLTHLPVVLQWLPKAFVKLRRGNRESARTTTTEVYLS